MPADKDKGGGILSAIFERCSELKEMNVRLHNIEKLLERKMTVEEDINAKLGRLEANDAATKAALVAIRQDIAGLKATGAISEAGAQAILGRLDALDTSTSATAADAQELDSETPPTQA